MNKQEIVSFPAGEALDLLLSDVFYSEVPKGEYEHFSPSTSLVDCHNLILVMRKKFWNPYIEGGPLGMWRVRFIDLNANKTEWVLEESFLLAICHSALMALHGITIPARTT